VDPAKRRERSIIVRLTLFGAAALLVAQSALSADSYILRHQTPQGSWEFDLSSVVVVNESVRRSQITLNLPKPLQDQPTGSVYDRMVFHYEHDCKENKMRVMDALSYLRGELVKTTRPADDWQPAGDSAAQKYACAMVQK
jgi:hypothetical protein